MYSLLKKLFSALLVMFLAAWILNLRVAGKPTRDWTHQFWNSHEVQKIYRGIRDRVMALIRKDISVEEVFKSELPATSSSTEKKADAGTATENKKSEEVKTINLEQLDEKDRQALERILDKAAK